MSNTNNFSLSATHHAAHITNDHEKVSDQSPLLPANHLNSVTKHTYKSRAPGKLILSGEHAILYGQPAIAFTVNRFAETIINAEPSDTIKLTALNQQYIYTIDDLVTLKKQIEERYKNFLSGRATIVTVLHHPSELIYYAIISTLQRHNIKLAHGLSVQLHSTIPLQCGMGSSAATIISLLLALNRYLSLSLSSREFIEHAIAIENLQHGQSSGFDIQTILTGGCIIRHHQSQLLLPVTHPQYYIVNTGQPAASTGECVSHVKKYFATSTIWHEFGIITHQIKQALLTDDWSQLQDGLRKNHYLLAKLGVVPETVKKFITELETTDTAAKICGAGSVRGAYAGMVLILTANPATTQAICEKYGFQLEALQIIQEGAHHV